MTNSVACSWHGRIGRSACRLAGAETKEERWKLAHSSGAQSRTPSASPSAPPPAWSSPATEPAAQPARGSAEGLAPALHGRACSVSRLPPTARPGRRCCWWGLQAGARAQEACHVIRARPDRRRPPGSLPLVTSPHKLVRRGATQAGELHSGSPQARDPHKQAPELTRELS